MAINLDNWLVTQESDQRITFTKDSWKIIMIIIYPGSSAWEGALTYHVYKNDEFLTSRNTIESALLVVKQTAGY